MNLSPHFTLAELCASATAQRLKIDNTPPPEVVTNLTRLAGELEKVRTLLGGVPLLIHSGYRSPALNAKVGGSPNSYHLLGLAADFDPPGGISHDTAQHMLAAAADLDYDLILEEGTVKLEAEGGSRWIHLQCPKVAGQGRRIIRDATVDRLGGKILRTAAG